MLQTPAHPSPTPQSLHRTTATAVCVPPPPSPATARCTRGRPRHARLLHVRSEGGTPGTHLVGRRHGDPAGGVVVDRSGGKGGGGADGRGHLAAAATATAPVVAVAAADTPPGGRLPRVELRRLASRQMEARGGGCGGGVGAQAEATPPTTCMRRGVPSGDAPRTLRERRAPLLTGMSWAPTTFMRPWRPAAAVAAVAAQPRAGPRPAATVGTGSVGGAALRVGACAPPPLSSHPPPFPPPLPRPAGGAH